MGGGEEAPNVRAVFLFVPNLIGYARILLAAVSFGLMPTRPGPAAACYGLAGLLDAVDGHAARALGQGSRLGAMLDMLTDRLSSLCLLLNLALLYPRWAGLFQLSMALDVASHWLHMHCSALQGASSHKAVGGEGHPLLRRYYQSRALLFLLCAGNEGFHCCLYLLHWGEGPPAFPGGPRPGQAGPVALGPLGRPQILPEPSAARGGPEGRGRPGRGEEGRGKPPEPRPPTPSHAHRAEPRPQPPPQPRGRGGSAPQPLPPPKHPPQKWAKGAWSPRKLRPPACIIKRKRPRPLVESV